MSLPVLSPKTRARPPTTNTDRMKYFFLHLEWADSSFSHRKFPPDPQVTLFSIPPLLLYLYSPHPASNDSLLLFPTQRHPKLDRPFPHLPIIFYLLCFVVVSAGFFQVPAFGLFLIPGGKGAFRPANRHHPPRALQLRVGNCSPLFSPKSKGSLPQGTLIVRFL